MPTDNELLRMIYLKIGQGGGMPTSVVSGTVGLDQPTLTALEQITIGGEVEVKNDSGSPIPVNVLNFPTADDPPIIVINTERSSANITTVVGSETCTAYATVPSGEEWQLQALSMEIQTSAIAGDRRGWVGVGSTQPNVHHRYYAGAVQTASQTCWYHFALGEPYLTGFVNNRIRVPMPPLILPSSWVFKYGLEGAQAGDQFLRSALLVNRRTLT